MYGISLSVVFELLFYCSVVGALVGSNLENLQVRLVDRNIEQTLTHVHRAVNSHAPPNGRFVQYFETATGPNVLPQPYEEVAIPEGVTVSVFRRHYGYSGYHSDLIVQLGSHPLSNWHFVQYDYLINDRHYSYSAKRKKSSAES